MCEQMRCYVIGCDSSSNWQCKNCRVWMCGKHKCIRPNEKDGGVYYYCVACYQHKPWLEAEGPTVLERAAELVDGPRQESYGHPADSFERAAQAWSAVLGHHVSPRAVCQCLIALKLVRDAHSPKEDNIVDIAGYARVIELIEKGE